MQDDWTKSKVRKRSLWRHILKLMFIFGVDLRTKRSSQNELSDCAWETRQESIERKISNKNTVDELDDARQNEEEQERVDEFETIGSLVVVSVPKGL